MIWVSPLLKNRESFWLKSETRADEAGETQSVSSHGTGLEDRGSLESGDRASVLHPMILVKYLNEPEEDALLRPQISILGGLTLLSALDLG